MDKIKFVDAKTIPIKCRAHLGSVEISLEEFSQLKEGDVLVLDHKVTIPLEFATEKDTLFYGFPGRVKEQKALKIEVSCDGDHA